MSDNLVSELNNGTFIITSEKFEREELQKAIYDYTNKSNFRSAYLNDNSGLINFKVEDIDNLAFNAQTNLHNILRINNIVRYFINKNDILGKVYEAIESNINSDWELSYPNYDESEKDTFEFVDNLIKDFNNKVNLNEIISESIPMTYVDGNYSMYLRKDTTRNNYQVDYFPLGVCEVADYNEGGEPYLLVSIKELETRLRKVYKKNKKNKALFYQNAEEEIKATYPSEVYQAYINKETYAVLNIKNTGLIRINNLKRKYGLTPIFKSLKPIIRLENIELSDDKNTLIRGKKILFQKLAKELITQAKEIQSVTWSSAQAKAHSDLMLSLQQNGTISVYTGLPWTESVEYVESKIEPTNVQVKNNYRNQIMTSIGIQFLSADKGSFGAAQISINELLKTINKIGEQLERILHKWYRGLLNDHNIDPKYCPQIKVLDSEKLNIELSMKLAQMLNTQLNASLETTYKVLGIDIKTEAKLRKQESENGYDEIFKPRMTAYTNSGKSNSDDLGRPKGNDSLDKQEYDDDYNKNNNR